MRNVTPVYIFDPDCWVSQDMDLLNEHRSLIHTGKVLRQPDGVADELFVMLFDNYCASLTS